MTTGTERPAAAPGDVVYRLAAWLSPAFPVGGYSYSHGLEYAVEAGLVRDAATLERWVAGILRDGSGRSDATLFAAVWRAVDAGDDASLADLADLGDCLHPTAEIRLESTAEGAAFLATVRQAWPHAGLDALARLLEARGRRPAYPLAVAAACACHGIPLRASLVAWLHAMAANLVSAGLRLVPLGQTDGQRVTAAVEPVVAAAADAAIARPLDDIGAAQPVVDWASMRHETQRTRLFRS